MLSTCTEEAAGHQADPEHASKQLQSFVNIQIHEDIFQVQRFVTAWRL